VEEILTGQDAKLKDAIFGKDGEAIPEDNVSVVDETKKKVGFGFSSGRSFFWIRWFLDGKSLEGRL
jgi:hypothetical protein